MATALPGEALVAAEMETGTSTGGTVFTIPSGQYALIQPIVLTSNLSGNVRVSSSGDDLVLFTWDAALTESSFLKEVGDIGVGVEVNSSTDLFDSSWFMGPGDDLVFSAGATHTYSFLVRYFALT